MPCVLDKTYIRITTENKHFKIISYEKITQKYLNFTKKKSIHSRPEMKIYGGSQSQTNSRT